MTALRKIRAAFANSPEPISHTLLAGIAFAWASVLLIYAWEMLG